MKNALKWIQGSFKFEKQLFTHVLYALVLYVIVSVGCPLLAQICQCLIYALTVTLITDYFLSLRPLDVEFMRRLSKVVNIVPVIAKADTLTLEERDFFKKKVVLFYCPLLSV